MSGDSVAGREVSATHIAQKPLVSTVVAFLNAEKYLAEAIESVLAQTYDNWELILVDDGSTDGSTQIAFRYAGHYQGKIRYLDHPNHQNRGKSVSRNLGVRHAHGEYIALLDADDVLLPYKMEQQVEILESHPEVGMVYGPVEEWFSWKEDPEESDKIQKFPLPQDCIPEADALRSVWVGNNPRCLPATNGTLLRRRLALSVGGFDEDFRNFEDMVFWVKVSLEAPIFVSSHCWGRYRQHAESSTAVQLRDGMLGAKRLQYLERVEALLAAHGLQQSKTWDSIQQQLWPSRHPIKMRALEVFYALRRWVRQLRLRMIPRRKSQKAL